jgi:hypothetical protein
MWPGGLIRQIGQSYWAPGWKSIPGLLKRFTNTGSAGRYEDKKGEGDAVFNDDICSELLFGNNFMIYGITTGGQLVNFI